MTADETGIQEVVKQLEDAWNASDSRSFAAQFAEDATFIQIFGGQLDGRAAIEGSHRAIFDTIYKAARLVSRCAVFASCAPTWPSCSPTLT